MKKVELKDLMVKLNEIEGRLISVEERLQVFSDLKVYELKEKLALMKKRKKARVRP